MKNKRNRKNRRTRWQRISAADASALSLLAQAGKYKRAFMKKIQLQSSRAKQIAADILKEH